MFKRIFFGFVFFTLVAGLSLAQQPWWYSLERGIHSFRNGYYGNALIAFEDARRDRANQFTRMEQDLIFLLSHPDVRSLGDSLEYVEMYIAANLETAAAAALAELYHRVPRNTLRDSALQALQELGRLKGYPEAEFWLGETYKAEGELRLALRHYERALLENPEFYVEILYRLVEVHRVLQNYNEMEERANEIIRGTGPSGTPRDIFWARSSTQGTGLMDQMRVAMIRILELEGVDSFLSLYRHHNLLTEKAHRFLGFFYSATNRHYMAAEHLMFAFLIQNTVLIDEAISREFDFTYTSLENLIESTRRRPELLSFIDEVEYYRTIFYLAVSLQATGRSIPATQLWDFLAGSNNAGEWGARARRNPTPYVERALEMP